MTALEAYRNRLAQYRINKALLGTDEIQYYTKELDSSLLDDDERQFLADSQAAYHGVEQGARDSLDDSERVLEASERINHELQQAKRLLERQRDELQEAHAEVEKQKRLLEEQNTELVETKNRLELAQRKIDHDLEQMIERQKLQEQLDLMSDRLKSQSLLLRQQNWMGPVVVAGTGLLFMVTGEQIVAGAFVTLASMYLQTVGGGFASFFGGREGSNNSSRDR